jgi:palmitoyl-protein thioesterase
MSQHLPTSWAALLVCIAQMFLVTIAAQRFRPVVLAPGLFCGDEGGIPSIAGWLHAEYPGIYIQNYTINHWASLLVDLDQQVENLAALIQSDPNLTDGFDMVAHSQGALVTRGYIQRYNNPPVHNWISLAGPNGGVFGVPDFNDWCPDDTCPWINDIFSELVEKGLTEPFLQDFVTFASYWKDPLHMSLFRNASAYLADINNERSVKNSTYRRNNLALNSMTLVLAELDHIVVPKESEWFGFFQDGSDSVMQNLTQTPTYLGDWIGLKTLDQQGKLHLLSAKCGIKTFRRIRAKSTRGQSYSH